MSESGGAIYVVDDDGIILESLIEFLRIEGYDADGGASIDEAMRALANKSYDLIITDINMPNANGFELLRVLKQRYPDVIPIMITGYGTIESAVEAIKMGAFDYLTKPIIDDELRLVITRAMEQRALKRQCQTLRDQLDSRYSLGSVVGHDYKMLRVYDLIDSVAESKVNVLIEGESGTGKSMIARVMHHRSNRRDKPFVEVSCGAIPDSLLESELFGHARGAFTGAVSDKAGKFSAADQGTLFLDEISAASPALQVKLLRVIQEREFEPIGSNKTIKVDVRLVLATNLDLESEVEAGRFRRDLFYRINVVTVSLPVLAERISDIPLLAKTFLEKYTAESNKNILGFTDEAMHCLQSYDWPGNVRELENAVERSVVLTKARHIGVGDLPPKIINSVSAEPSPASFDNLTLKTALEEPERRVIEAALRRNDWSRRLTAQQLDINRTTLYKKMKRYGLDVEPTPHVARTT